MTPEFLMIAIACGVGMAVGCFMSARRNLRHLDYGFITVVRAYDQEGEMDGSQQLSLIEAMEHRNEVLEAVADNSSGWLKMALEAMQQLPEGTVSTGEGFRLMLLERGLVEPRHVNSWGALTGTLTRRGMLVPTGELQPMKTKSSHGRATRVYRLQRPEAA